MADIHSLGPELIEILSRRFHSNVHRHPEVPWERVEQLLRQSPEKLASLGWMEQTGGEPDVVVFDPRDPELCFVDCSPESPDRRSLCYDRKALDARKENKLVGAALEVAAEHGVEILDELQYRALQRLGNFDQRTSSWLATPPEVRKLGGAIFGDRRYDRVFIYHNGVQSYYASRGFRATLWV